MLLVELIGELRSCEFAHLQLGDGETVLVNGVNDLPSLGVTVRLDHGKGSLSLALEIVLGEDVAILDELKLS